MGEILIRFSKSSAFQEHSQTLKSFHFSYVLLYRDPSKMDSKVKILDEKEESRIHLQLPNVSGESGVSEDARGLEVDAESTADEEEIPTRSRPNSLTSSNGTEDLYEMLHELPSIRNAAWALRKAIVTSASSRKRSKHGESGVNEGKGSRKKVTFTRTCCAAGRQPKRDSDANTSDCTSSSSIVSDVVAEDEDKSKRNRIREPMQMHSINLYQSILPPSLFPRK